MNKKTIAVYAVTFIIIFLIDFGLLSFLSKELNKENYLFYINTLNALPFFSSLIGFGTPFAITYLASLHPRYAYKFLTESNTLAIRVVVIIIITSAPLVYLNLLPNYFPISAIIGFFLVVKQNSVNYFLALKKLNAASYIRLNQKIIFSLILIVFINLVLVGNEYVLSFGLIAGEIIGLLLLQKKYQVIKLHKLTKIKSITKISKYHFFAALIASLSLATPVFILNLFKLEISAIASFAIALQVLKYFTLILAPFMQLITPILTPLKNEQRKVQLLYFQFLGVTFSLGIASGLVLYYSSNIIANYFFSNEYKNIARFLEIFSWCIPFIMASSYSATALVSIGGIKNALTINVIMLLCITAMSSTLYKISIEHYAMLIAAYYIIYFFVVQFFLQKAIAQIKPLENYTLE